MDRQRGSHMIFKGFTNGRERTVVVPKHGEIAVGTLMSILGQGITIEEFDRVLEKS